MGRHSPAVDPVVHSESDLLELDPALCDVEPELCDLEPELCDLESQLSGFEPALPELTHFGPTRLPAEFNEPFRFQSSPVSRRSRVEERALARARSKRRRLLRYSAIPVTCALLAGYLIEDPQHLISSRASASADRTVSTPDDFSALATGTEATSLTDGTLRVSRSKRSALPIAQDASATALPARPGMPAVDPYKTVAGTWFRPSAGGMSSCFCMRWGVLHDGIDLAGPMGSPIVSTGDGLVLEAGPAAGFGNWIVIQQANGDVTIYGHMYTVLVSKGQRVTAGQHIADIGEDGEATGPHLHFGVRKGGIDGPYIDPVPWLRARGVNVGSYDPNA